MNGAGHVIVGVTAMLCVTAIVLYALSLGYDTLLLISGLSIIAAIATGGAAYVYGHRIGGRKIIDTIKRLKQ